MLPEKKAPIKKTRARAKKTKAASRLKDMIKAAREKLKEENNQEPEENRVFVGGYFEIKTPLKQPEVCLNPFSNITNIYFFIIVDTPRSHIYQQQKEKFTGLLTNNPMWK